MYISIENFKGQEKRQGLRYFLPINIPSALGLGFFSYIVFLSLPSTFEVFVTLDALNVLVAFILLPFSITFDLPTNTSWGPCTCCNTSHNCSLVVLSCIVQTQ